MRWKAASGGLAERLFGIDLRALAALRIAIGVLLVVDLLIRSQDLAALYTDQGVLPRALLAADPLRNALSVHFWGGSVFFQAFLFVLEGVLAVLLALGVRTRIVTVGCWVLHTSLCARNPLVTDYGDTMIRMVLFWGMFLPLGARASWDARHRPASPLLPPTLTSVATAALLIQAFLVYFFAGVYKSGPDWSADGTAMHYVLNQDWWLRPMGGWIAENFSGLLPTVSRLVRWLEVLVPIALFSPVWTGPLRIGATLLSWGFQVGIGLSIVLNWMPFVTSAIMLPFLPSTVWDAVERRLGGTNRPAAIPAGNATPPSARGPIERLLSVVVALLLAFVVAWNFVGFSDEVELPEPAKRLGKLLQIHQQWAMYSPGGPRFDGWYVIEAELADGTRRNLWRNRPLTWEKPAHLSSTHPSTRWALYEFGMARPTGSPPRARRAAWGRYLCRTWNSANPGTSRVERFHIVFVLERTPPPGAEQPTRRLSILEQECADVPAG